MNSALYTLDCINDINSDYEDREDELRRHAQLLAERDTAKTYVPPSRNRNTSSPRVTA